jgi:hypothetical protein
MKLAESAIGLLRPVGQWSGIEAGIYGEGERRD